MLYKDQYPQLPGPLNPTNPLFLELGILKIYDVFKLQVTKFIFIAYHLIHQKYFGIGLFLIILFIITIQFQIQSFP